MTETPLGKSNGQAPLAIDLYAGLGGWTDGLLAEGYDVVGFDLERHVYGEARYPAQLVIQDVLTLHGAQFKDAALIVASPPCQAYSYMAMPWTRAKRIAAEYRDGTRDRMQLTALFDACFRIQREACEAAGHHIPLVVENVRGAQPWVGRANWAFGSFLLWGDVPALMPITRKTIKGNGGPWFKDADSADGAYAPGNFRTTIEGATKVSGLNWSNFGKEGYKAKAFNGQADQRLRATKNDGGSWFAVAHNTTSGKGQNPDGRKVPSESGRRTDVGKGARFTSQDCGIEASIANAADGHKQRGSGPEWWRGEVGSKSSKSSARKAASAHIAKIPLPLARWIARAWR